MTSKQEVVEQRKLLNQLAEHKHSFNKGDRRMKSPRLCVCCSRPLTSLIINENKYIVIQNHTRYQLGGWVVADICTDINSCYRTLRKKGELIEDVDGRQHKE